MESQSKHMITKVVKDNRGEITAYQLENGEIVMKDQAIEMARQGAIQGVNVATSKKGEEFLRGIGDGNITNNLSNLPTIDESEIR